MGFFRLPLYRGDLAGFANPLNQGSLTQIDNVFGPRPFSAHLTTTGFDYDFHRGVDFPDGAVGDPVYAATAGAITRRVYSHFHWNSPDQLNLFTETDPLSALEASAGDGALTLNCSGQGVATFPGQASLLTGPGYIYTTKDDWVLEINIPGISTSAGEVGIIVRDRDEVEHLALSYDGSTITFRGATSVNGPLAEDGTTYAVAGANWIRLTYTTGVVAWEHSTDGTTWTTLGSDNFVQVSDVVWKPSLFWLSTAASGNDVVSVGELNWVDEAQSVGRFGNWVTIGRNDGKIIQVHLDEVDVELGEMVAAGQRIGTVGKTGFGVRSGRIVGVHVHLEWSPVQDWNYSQEEARNPLAPDLLPRTDSTANVSAVLTNENDPDGVDSWKVSVTTSRADQDFDMDAVSLTGNLGTRTVSFNARTGLNTDRDIPLFNGVYIVPSSFNSSSEEYECSFYFHRSVVGTTFVSGEVRDTEGTLLTTISE